MAYTCSFMMAFVLLCALAGLSVDGRDLHAARPSEVLAANAAEHTLPAGVGPVPPASDTLGAGLAEAMPEAEVLPIEEQQPEQERAGVSSRVQATSIEDAPAVLALPGGPQVLLGPTRQVTATRAAREAAALQQELAAAAATRAAFVVGMSPAYQGILDKHNSNRAKHAAPALAWSDPLASRAAWYAAQCRWGHSGTPGAGENLYAVSNTADTAFALNNAIDLWYAEASQYNYAAPGFSAATGHFTQVVWRATSSIGCAAQVCSRGIAGTGWSSGILVVCQYTPAGNVLGQFPANVQRPNSSPPPASPPVGQPQQPAIPPATLPAGYKFISPGCLSSANKRFRLCLLDSGNLVLYQVATALWASNSGGSPAKPFKLALQTGGNLVVADNLDRVVWQSRSSGPGPQRLVVSDDGNAAVFDGSGRVLWATNTRGQ